jgi:hypothetical protein
MIHINDILEGRRQLEFHFHLHHQQYQEQKERALSQGFLHPHHSSCLISTIGLDDFSPSLIESIRVRRAHPFWVVE